MTTKSHSFWETKTLEQMSDTEWESLCDRCGKCCRVKLQDDETNKIYTTSVTCKLLNTEKLPLHRLYQSKKNRPYLSRFTTDK